MIAMDVRLSDRSEKFLVEQARKFPREVRRAFYYACGVALRNMRSMMRGKSNKIAKWDDFTRQLRAANNRTKPMGGVLAEKGRIVAYKQNGYQIIGWPDALASWAVKFQDGAGGSEADNFLNDPKSRHYLHKKGIRDIPRVYAHNPRKVLPEPFGSYVKKNLDEWARNVFYKDLARQMAKGAAA